MSKLVTGALYGPKKISLLSNDGQPDTSFLYTMITEWQNDPKRAQMFEAQDYFDGRNDKISKKQRMVVGEGGNLVPCQRLENTKLAHSFLHKLTKQKVSYLLSKDFSIQTENKKFEAVLGDFFDKDFMRSLKNVGKDSIVNGLAWVQMYYDEDGVLKAKRIPSEEVYPFWKDADHTQLEAVLRLYSLWHYDDKGNKTEVKKVEYYTDKGVWYYQLDDGLIPDPDKSETLGSNFRMEVKKVNEETGEEEVSIEGVMWNKIPFICFKYNAEESSLLAHIKDLVDEYDFITSGLSDAIKDSPRSAKVVRGFEGTNKQEFIHNLSTLGVIFTGEEGGVENLAVDIEHESSEVHLTRLRKDIFEFGGGVDTQNENFGVASGVAIKFRYADLDMDCSFMANEFSAALEQMVWFIAQDQLLKNGADYTEEDVDFVFNTDLAMNESEVIDNLAKSSDLSLETRLAMHPYVTDVQAELARKKKEQEEQMDMLGFDSPDNDNPSDEGDLAAGKDKDKDKDKE